MVLALPLWGLENPSFTSSTGGFLEIGMSKTSPDPRLVAAVDFADRVADILNRWREGEIESEFAALVLIAVAHGKLYSQLVSDRTSVRPT